MKNYFAPEMKVVAFLPEENVAASGTDKPIDNPNHSNIFNDAEFGW